MARFGKLWKLCPQISLWPCRETVVSCLPYRADHSRFLHRTAFSPSSLHTLALIHGNSLRELRVYELEPFPTTSTVLPTGLTTFQCHSVGDGKAAAQLVHANQKSLERLRLGQEKELVEAYKRTRIGYLEQVPSGADILHESIRLGELPALLELDLCGIDLSALVPKTGEEGHDFCRLQRLSIESCPASVLFLEAIAAAFYDAQNPGDPSRIRADPRLKEFLLRSETPTTALKETLVRFLASFRGLETLSLLLENAALLDGPSTMIAEHGPTLRTLVMESRIQPRESLTHDTSRPFGVGAPSEELWEQSINDICQLCPNLEELGTGFPWGIETVRLRRTKLPSLKNLKTIHIRNFPSSQVLLQLGDYTIKEHATKFIEWVVSPTKGGNKPSLETLAIGPTLYESRWRSSNTRRQPPEYLKTHYFWLDFGQTRFGRWSPMVSAVSDTCMAEMRGDKLSKGVFEQIWLR